MNEKDIQEKIEKDFSCRRCGECCRKPGFVYLSEREAEEAAAFLDLEIREFMDRYCDLLDRRQIVLKKLPDEACIFLKGQECVIHPAKPGQCRDFPRKWRTPASFEYCQGLKVIFS